MKKITLLMVVLLLLVGSSVASAKVFDLGKAGEFELSSYITAEVSDLKNVSLKTDFIAFAGYRVDILPYLSFNAGNTVTFNLNEVDIKKYDNELNLYLDLFIGDRVGISAGTVFDKEWKNTYYAKSKVIIF